MDGLGSSAMSRCPWPSLARVRHVFTWEELHALHQLHTSAPAWGHAASLGGGIVTTNLTTEEQRKEWKKQSQNKKTTKRVAHALLRR